MTSKMVCCSGAALLAMGLAAHGYILAQDTWDVAEGWAEHPGGGPISAAFVDAAPNLDIQVGTAGDFNVNDDIYYGDAPLAGNLDYTAGGSFPLAVGSVTFDFYADSGGATPYPGALSLYFLYESGGAEYAWYYDFDVTGLGLGWNSLAANMTFGAGWYTFALGQNNEAGFLASLADVDEIGVYIAYVQDQAGQQYGVDNFTLNGSVPEPGTYAMLGFSMLSLGVTFRRKLSVTLANLKARC